jgi:hypothetical protein
MSYEIDVEKGATNHLTISCVGETLSVSVNGVLLSEINDSRLSSGGWALFSATRSTGGGRVLFDNLIIRGP